jgi:transcriptional regulator with XRE-family HTH domain
LTQEKLAGKMGTSPKWLGSLENGRENPTLDKLISLAQALQVDLGEIFTFVEVEDPRKRKALLEGLLKKADDEQLKLAVKVLMAVIG